MKLLKKFFISVFHRCPVTVFVLVTYVLFGGISVRGAKGLYREIPASAGFEPFCAPMMKGIHEGIYPWSGETFAAGREDFELVGETVGRGMLSGGQPVSVRGYAGVSDNRVDSEGADGDTVSGNELTDRESVSGNGLADQESVSGNVLADQGSVSGNRLADQQTVSGNEAAGQGTVSAREPLGQQNVFGGEDRKPVSGNGSGDQSGVSEDVVSEPVFCHVEEDYFDDALFIGDSRTVGLFEYGKIEDRAEFYAKTSLTIYDIIEKQKAIVKTEDEREAITVEEALSENQFGKIYIMMGLNEMGTGTAESFAKAYANVIDRIRELQPQAIIYIQSIMRVAAEKNETDPVFNNANIDIRNDLLAQLADNRTVFYIDVNEAVCDENGCLVEDWTFDQVHLKAAYYKNWKDVLLEHGIVR